MELIGLHYFIVAVKTKPLVASNSVAGADHGTLATWPAAHGFYCSWERGGTVAGKSGGTDGIMDPGTLTAYKCSAFCSKTKQTQASLPFLMYN